MFTVIQRVSKIYYTLVLQNTSYPPLEEGSMSYCMTVIRHTRGNATRKEGKMYDKRERGNLLR